MGGRSAGTFGPRSRHPSACCPGRAFSGILSPVLGRPEMRRAVVLGLVLLPLWGCTEVGQGMQTAGETISAEAHNPRNEIRTQPHGGGGDGGY